MIGLVITAVIWPVGDLSIVPFHIRDKTTGSICL